MSKRSNTCHKIKLFFSSFFEVNTVNTWPVKNGIKQFCIKVTIIWLIVGINCLCFLCLNLSVLCRILFEWLDYNVGNLVIMAIPLQAKQVREVANLTKRKNPPVSGVKEFVCLSVCQLQTITPIISGLAKQNGLKQF